MITRYQRYLVDPLVAPVTTLVINRQIALVGLPGEPFVGLQLSLKQRSPLPATFLCGYTNGYIAYFPTIRDAVVGGYGAHTITTRVEVGAGERMVDRGLIHIYRILGKCFGEDMMKRLTLCMIGLIFVLCSIVSIRAQDRIEQWRGKTVMVFTPHPDDDLFGCGGTLSLLARNQNKIIIVIRFCAGRRRS